MSQYKAQFESLKQFFMLDLWTTDLAELPVAKRRSFAGLRVAAIVVRGYLKDKCSLQASALTYITLMSMVPFLALIFAIAKGVGAQEHLRSMVEGWYEELPEQVIQVLAELLALVDSTNFAALGIVGLVVVIFTAVRTLTKVETTLNSIWGVREGRATTRRFSDYLSVIIVVPIAVLAVSAINGVLSSTALAHLMEGAFLAVYEMLLRVAAIVFVTLAFGFMYYFLPNTRVKLKSAAVGGVVGGILWIIFQWLCLHLQSLLFASKGIYGAFAAVPVFLLWVWLNWNIVLFGAEVSFAVQNYTTYVMESEAAQTSYNTRRHLAYLMAHDITKAYLDGHGPWIPAAYQHRYHVSIRLLRDVLFQLKQAGVLVEVPGKGYLPARDVRKITLADIENALQGELDPRVKRAARRLDHAFDTIIDAPKMDPGSRLARTSLEDMVKATGDAPPDDLGDVKYSRTMVMNLYGTPSAPIVED